MSKPFAFPPPPPPPSSNQKYSPQNQVFQNGRGTHGGGYGNRGSSRGGRGNYGNARPGPPVTGANSYGQTNYYQNNVQHGRGRGRGGPFNPPQKRDYISAFKPAQQHHHQSRPRPTAPPAVPDFNASLSQLLAPKSPVAPQPPTPKPSPQAKKTTNLLGLTPSYDSASETSDNDDEEQKLSANPAASLGGYVFEYNDSPFLLRTPAEIQAWLVERRKRYPTAAKREAGKKEAEEKRLRWEEEKKAREKAWQEERVRREQERANARKAREDKKRAQQKARALGDSEVEVDAATKARLKAEKLRKRAEKAQQELEVAEEALRLAKRKAEGMIGDGDGDASSAIAAALSRDEITGQVHAPLSNGVSQTADTGTPAQLPAEPRDEDETSSSGSSSPSDTDQSSDSDSDAAPETISTKHPPPTNSRGPPSKPTPTDRPICRAIAQHRPCKYGRRCHYSHDLSAIKKARQANGVGEEKLGKSASGTTKRKGLWQVMMEKEQEEERKRMLGAIMRLGERGLLDDPTNG